jgi:hypothetical protein
METANDPLECETPLEGKADQNCYLTVSSCKLQEQFHPDITDRTKISPLLPSLTAANSVSYCQKLPPSYFSERQIKTAC